MFIGDAGIQGTCARASWVGLVPADNHHRDRFLAKPVLTNIVKCRRPPKPRSPSDAVATCEPYLKRHVVLQPKRFAPGRARRLVAAVGPNRWRRSDRHAFILDSSFPTYTRRALLTALKRRLEVQTCAPNTTLQTALIFPPEPPAHGGSPSKFAPTGEVCPARDPASCRSELEPCSRSNKPRGDGCAHSMEAEVAVLPSLEAGAGGARRSRAAAPSASTRGS